MIRKFPPNTNFIERLRKGDEKAFSYLIGMYQQKLQSYVTCLTNDYSMAQDIVQEVFLDLWRNKRKLTDMELPALQRYIYTIAYHKFINLYHKHRAISSLERAYIEALDHTFDAANSDILDKKIALVSEGIKKLPKKCKQAFLMSKKEGLTNMEIAEHMNISVKTVEGHLTKAYNLLRDQVGGKIRQLLFVLWGAIKTH